jgi:type III secretion protein U
MGEKTEQPTPKKLRDARKRGEVAASRQLTSFVVFVGLLASLWLGARFIFRHLAGILEQAILAPGAIRADPGRPSPPGVQSMLHDAAWITGLLLAVGIGSAVLAGALQTRGVFSFTPLTPKFERINPAQGLRKLFSTRQLFELGKVLTKIALLAGAVSWSLARSLDSVLKMAYAPVTDLLSVSGDIVLSLMTSAALVYALDAAFDYAHQFHEFMKGQRMSIEEVRREFRDAEGDPHLKSQRRSTARELVEERMLDRVPSASVVIANPTHVCVALYYVPGETALPRVVAKGVDAVALRIRSAARRAAVPVFEDPPLARRLFCDVALDAYITDSLIDPIAAAFRWARQAAARPAPAAGTQTEAS